MKKYRNWIFAAVCLTILGVLIAAPEETTPRTPDNPTHENPTQYQNCPRCHLPDGDGPPMRTDHFGEPRVLRLDHTKCYMCHKPVRK